jgi:kynureninase
MEELARWRTLFPTLNRCCYLISNSCGAMPSTVPGALAAYIAQWEEHGVEAWETWFPLVREACARFGALISADAETVCPVNNVTTATAAVLSCFDFTGRRCKVVTTTGEFTSVLYVLQAWQKYGAELAIVPPAEVESAIDSETALVAVSHVLFRDSELLPLAAIAAAARRAGALLFVDAYQSFGVVPLDVQALGIDLLASGVLKWGCGGPGAAYLYVSPERQSALQPAIRGWLGHERPFDFEPEMRYAPGAFRFALSSLTVPSHLTAIEGMKVLAAVGVETIRARNRQLTERLIAAADEAGIPVIGPRQAGERGGHVTLAPPYAENVARRMIAGGIIVDYRKGSGIRIAPHFYNTEAEVDEAVAAMARLTSTT